MATTIRLNNGLSPRAEQWLYKNVGPRMHYLHNSIGGQGWVAKLENEQVIRETSDGEKYTSHSRVWKLTLEDDKLATWFTIMFS
jgi:hypothetical protein